MTWEEGAGCYEACSRLLGRSPSKACFLCDRPRHAGFWQRSRHRRASLRCAASPGLAPGAVVPPVRPQVCRRACGPWARWGTWAHPAPSPSRSPTCKGGRRLLPAPRDCRGRSQVKHSRPLAPPIRCGCSLCRVLWRRPGTFQVLPSESGSECHQLVPFSLPGPSAKVTRDEPAQGTQQPSRPVLLP